MGTTCTYQRKTRADGRWADPGDGDPSLTTALESAFPGYHFICVFNGPVAKIIFDATLDAGQITTVDTVYADWDPDSSPAFTTLPATTSLSEDVSTTATDYTDLLSTTAYLRAGQVTVYVEVGCETSQRTGSTDFRVLMDGNSIRDFSVHYKGTGNVTVKPTVTEGSHTFGLQWRVGVGTTNIRPLTKPAEYATLVLQ